jgi:hypothetical protein
VWLTGIRSAEVARCAHLSYNKIKKLLFLFFRSFAFLHKKVDHRARRCRGFATQCASFRLRNFTICIYSISFRLSIIKYFVMVTWELLLFFNDFRFVSFILTKENESESDCNIKVMCFLYLFKDFNWTKYIFVIRKVFRSNFMFSVNLLEMLIASF